MTTTTEYVTEITGRILTDPLDVTGSHLDLGAYFTLLRSLGLECSSEKAAEAWAHARAMGAARNQARMETFDLGTVAAQLGRGDLTAKQAEKAIQFPVSSEYRATKVKLYDIAHRVALQVCRDALRAAGDDLLASPRTAIERALSQPEHVDSEDLFAAGVRLLAMVHAYGAPRLEGARREEYLYARPDLVDAWVGENGRGFPAVREIAAHADEWGPGVYTATEVLDNAKVFAPIGPSLVAVDQE